LQPAGRGRRGQRRGGAKEPGRFFFILFPCFFKCFKQGLSGGRAFNQEGTPPPPPKTGPPPPCGARHWARAGPKNTKVFGGTPGAIGAPHPPQFVFFFLTGPSLKTCFGRDKRKSGLAARGGGRGGTMHPVGRGGKNGGGAGGGGVGKPEGAGAEFPPQPTADFFLGFAGGPRGVGPPKTYGDGGGGEGGGRRTRFRVCAGFVGRGRGGGGVAEGGDERCLIGGRYVLAGHPGGRGGRPKKRRGGPVSFGIIGHHKK